MEFEWDLRKDAANQQKHGGGFRMANLVFGDPPAKTFPDVNPSILEHCFLTIGASANCRLLVVAHADRDETI